MNFFEQQDRAKSKTARLIVYFSMAVIGLILLLYVLLMMTTQPKINYDTGNFQVWDAYKFFGVAAVVVLIVGSSSMYKIHSLRGGGGVVATSLGGRRVEPFTQNAGERRLLNVVEEMALASGTPVPEVYLLPDSGINAFAAGYTPDDAAVAVTRGCVDSLSRDELQGVVAHEFSHILNGDMRLNIKLMGVVFGILVIALIGEGIMRGLRHASSSRRNSKEGGGVIITIFVLALSLYAIGHFGVFFGRLIQSAISREREYLADAAAVQFTRNPEGIAGALKRIGGMAQGSRVDNAHAGETAHFFFANGLKSSFLNFFATHPPLHKRIRAIEPQWDGKFFNKPARARKQQKPPPLPGKQQPQRDAFDPMRMILTVGTLTAASLEQARELRESLEADFAQLIRGPLEARALIYALVLDADNDRREEQIAYLVTEAGDELGKTVRELYKRVHQRERRDYLPLLEIALPALSQMEPVRAQAFQERLRALVLMDGSVNVFEFVATHLVRKHFERRAAQPPSGHIWSASAMAEPLSKLLSMLVYLNTQDTASAKANFAAAAASCEVYRKHLRFIPKEQLDFPGIEAALDKLTRASFGLRKQMLEVCAAAISQDGLTTPDEAELFRAISVSLDCPMPPILAA